MNAEIKAKWCEALRSGAYPQTTQMMYRRQRFASYPHGYCCLGVLASVMGESDDAIEGHGKLSEQQRVKAGLSVTQQQTLIIMNDGRGKTFAEIADFVEQEL